jgi:hypothetical protein
MKTKKEKEIKKALAMLKRHNLSIFTYENKEFLEEWIFEYWKAKDLKPTKKNLDRVREKAMEYVIAESFASDIMYKAIDWLAMKQSFVKK